MEVEHGEGLFGNKIFEIFDVILEQMPM